MEERRNIPAGYSTAQVAKRLGVSQHEVSRLIRVGSLEATMTDAGIYVINPDSVHRHERVARMKGRPWDPDTAWAALLLLEGEASSGLGYHRERRLRLKLAEVSAERLVTLMRKRMTAMRFSVSPSFAEDLKGCLTLSGISSPYAASLGLTAGSSQGVDGYPIGSVDELVEKFFLFPDGGGTCILRESHGLPDKLKGLPDMPPVVVAADLAVSVDERERCCGLEYLDRRLDEFRDH